jgi:hypothetical protein
MPAPAPIRIDRSAGGDLPIVVLFRDLQTGGQSAQREDNLGRAIQRI